MRSIFGKWVVLCTALMTTIIMTAAVKPDDFNKYEIVSTTERSVAGIDAKGLIVYGKNNDKVTAYDLLTDSPVFDLVASQDKVAPFNSDGTAVVTGKEGYASAVVSKNGTILAQLPEGYVYAGEYRCGFICIIDKNATENVYTLIDRKGNIIAEHFYEPACELKNGDIIIRNTGGGHSLVKTDGSVTEMPYMLNIQIEDAVSLNTGVYVSTDGNVYSYNNKLIYKNRGFDHISPIDENYALGIKHIENGSKRYIIDIKDKKETELLDQGLFDGYIYTRGNVCNDRVFVGNSVKSVLVNLKNGKILSSPVTDYSDFYGDIATVKTGDEKKPYRFMNCEGEFVGSSYDFASSFENGYSVVAEKASHLVIVSIMNEKGKKVHMESVFSPDVYSADKQPDYVTEGFSKCRFDEITVEKTVNGDFCIYNRNGNSYVYVNKGGGNPVSKALAVICALCAMVAVILSIDRSMKYNNKKEKMKQKNDMA